METVILIFIASIFFSVCAFIAAMGYFVFKKQKESIKKENKDQTYSPFADKNEADYQMSHEDHSSQTINYYE